MDMKPLATWHRTALFSVGADDKGLYGHSQFDPVVRRVNQILLGTQVPFRRLNGSMPQQQLNLLKLATRRAAHLRA